MVAKPRVVLRHVDLLVWGAVWQIWLSKYISQHCMITQCNIFQSTLLVMLA